jgi:peptidoglycan-associated lipoprotein
MNMKLLGALAAVSLLAACSSGDQNAAATGAGAGAGPRPGSQEDLVANVGDRVFFDTDRSNIRADQRATLERQSAWMGRFPQVQVMVEGHADERGTREYNIALSARRATAAREYLISQGVAANRISSIAYGKERPAALCDAEQCWSQNRRAVTVITGGAK